ncbi:MAG TPA: ATP-binding protein [Williamwhitmania sp.]|nr:ATP-binding protein [Williamwhitmania sp.]
MRINLKQAVSHFYVNPTLELVLIEAIANSIDAEATKVEIEISIEEFSKPKTLNFTVKDNGVGFTNERFEKFSKLLEAEEDDHKGLGRLVFLSYFKDVEIVSKYENKQRTFKYNFEFDEKSRVANIEEGIQETKLSFKNYFKSKIRSHDTLRPVILKKTLLQEFYPRLYLMKQEGKELSIFISLSVDKPDSQYMFVSDKQQISLTDLLELKIEKIENSGLELFDHTELHYSIKKALNEKTIITALCIDGRTYNLDIISDENIPFGYEIIFLLHSSFFKGKVNASRQELTFDEHTKKTVIRLFRNKVQEVLSKEIPVIIERNTQTKESLANTYPHLLGFFDIQNIGFIKKEDSIKKAQERFFKAQRDVLEANDLSDETYMKSLEMSSRALTEYILYRQITINKLKEIDKNNDEADIHNLIVPKGRILKSEGLVNDLYSNNAWLLDDKYMTYNTILSDKVMSRVIKEIAGENEIGGKDNTEPDIVLIFSNDPDKSEKVDVVIIELKKRGVKLEENVAAIVQLQTRATKLMQLYPNKIQRIWFYAIVEFNNDFKLYLENNRYTSLFSKDIMYYNEYDIKTSLEQLNTARVGIYVLSLDAFISDADARNSTLLAVLKEHFKGKE